MIGAIVAACGGANQMPIDAAGDGGSDSDAAGDGASAVTGTVTLIGYQPKCDASFGTPIGATVGGTSNPNLYFQCAVVTVSCLDQGDDDTQAEVALTGQADGSLGKGVVVTHAGQEGTNFGAQLSPNLYADGWDLAQIAWAAPWECPKHNGSGCAVDSTPEATRPGIKNGGCRPATLIKWIHDSAVRVDGTPFLPQTKGFCGHGSSGGSGAFWYSLVHYGSSAQLDFALLAASTPFGRMDIACDPNHATTTTTAACQNVANPPQVTVSTGGRFGPFDKWSSTDTCGTTPSAADLDLWSRNSIVSPGADFDFRTPVSTYDCVDAPTINIVPGMGAYVFDKLHENDPQSQRFRAQCAITGSTGNGGSCTGEQVFDDPNMVSAALTDMNQHCRKL